MSFSLINKLKALVEEDGSNAKIETLEDVIVEEIKKYVEGELFYELPTKEILKIIGKSKIDNVELLCKLATKMCAAKGEESTLLLNVIKKEDASLEECVKIISNFKYSQLCMQIGNLFIKNENEELNNEIEDIQQKINEIKTGSPPVADESPNCENSIGRTIEKGDIDLCTRINGGIN